jgi:hypothetical protein
VAVMQKIWRVRTDFSRVSRGLLLNMAAPT